MVEPVSQTEKAGSIRVNSIWFFKVNQPMLRLLTLIYSLFILFFYNIIFYEYEYVLWYAARRNTEHSFPVRSKGGGSKGDNKLTFFKLRFSFSLTSDNGDP